MMIDPVCGMTVRPGGPHELRHGGETYGFCSGHCLAAFEKDPSTFLASEPI